MVLKAYVLSDGPPSICVRQTLVHLKAPHQQIPIDYYAGDHKTKEYELMNPQNEIPVIDDDGFYLSESVAIMQYICDKYAPGSSLYPQDPKARAVVNHRLCFSLSTFYRHIFNQAMSPLYIPGYVQSPNSVQTTHKALDIFETYLQRAGTSHSAADHLTIADFPIINSLMVLEATDFDFSKYEKINKLYKNFKKNYPELWKISEDCMKEIIAHAAKVRVSGVPALPV